MIRIFGNFAVGLAILSALACAPEQSVSSKGGEDGEARIDANESQSKPRPSKSDDPIDATYLIDSQPVALNRGVGLRSPVAGQALNAQRIRVLGRPLFDDLDKDGDDDAVLLLSLDSAGQSPRYFIGSALRSKSGFVDGNSLYLGDGISQPTLTLSHGALTASYYFRVGMNLEAQSFARTVRARWINRRFELL